MSEIPSVAGVMAGVIVVSVFGATVGRLLNRMSREIMDSWKEGERLLGRKHDYSDADFNIGRVHGWRGEVQSEMLGFVERLTYFGLLLAGAHSVLAALLALKVASKWRSWGYAGRVAINELRAIRTEIGYIRFLLGTSANVLYALVGFGVALGVSPGLAGGG